MPSLTLGDNFYRISPFNIELCYFDTDEQKFYTLYYDGTRREIDVDQWMYVVE
jgi:hypothetical protein